MYSHPLPYLHYLVHFHIDQDYFECHEVLEDYWKKQTDQKRDSVWVGLIQVAVAFYHHRRGNWRGSEKMLQKAIDILKKQMEQLDDLGIDSKSWLQQLSGRLAAIQHRHPFSPSNIPFTDCQIIEEYKHFQRSCLPEVTANPGKPDPFIIHKHAMRDRSEVISERLKALALRKPTNPSIQ